MNYLVENIHSSWNKCFQSLTKEIELVDLALANLPSDRIVYPPKEKIFNAFRKTPWEATKIVILGQDPYHGYGEAMGLSFSVPDGVALPPSLRNIFKERESDLSIPLGKSGDLSSWAEQGVLLLNSMLTVESDCAGSHSTIGWEQFTNGVIRWISNQSSPIIFVLWGKFAEKKRPLIDESRHRVLISAHPSPLSAYRGFFGSRPFSKINEALIELGHAPVDWHNE